MSKAMRTVRFPSGELIDRLKPIEFTFDGKKIEAYEGDTLGSALAAQNIKVLSRSFKYHRPRGLMCVSGQCPNCLVEVNGSPNIRACTTKVKNKMNVKSQNRWPTIRFDLLSILDKLDLLLPVGFYYKSFYRPSLLWSLVRPLFRKAGGLGRINTESTKTSEKAHKTMFSDVAIVGSGLSGLSAAIAAAEHGSKVSLIEKHDYLGGNNKDVEENELITKVLSNKSISVMTGTPVFGFYPPDIITLDTPEEMIKLHCKKIILATGCHEVPIIFENNDLPGIMSATGTIKLLRLYGVIPGNNVVIITETNTGYTQALELQSYGLNVVAVLDSRDKTDSKTIKLVNQADIPFFAGVKSIKAVGSQSIKNIKFDYCGEWYYLDCDLTCYSGRLQPALQLALQAGCSTEFDANLNTLIPTSPPNGISLTGGLIGITDKDQSIKHGRSVGIAVAKDKGDIHLSLQQDTTKKIEFENLSSRKGFICYCEDVTSKDLSQAVKEGFTDIQILKRYSTITMGPCQGKMCLTNFLRESSVMTGSRQAELGLTTLRPPIEPITLGSLAGPGFIPVKRTPLHNIHLELGAKMVEVGGWIRPYSYTDPYKEVSAVRNNVGVIDVSTLGKLDIRGRDASKLLDFIYVNKISNLKAGRVRYGVMCLENGTVLDDGTVAKLSDNRFFVTTTTTNIEAIESWFKWWLAADTNLDVKIANVTSELAAINIAGPNARKILQDLTTTNIETDEFPYMSAKQAVISGVSSIIMRIGFVGEIGWEIHFPSVYAEYLWGKLYSNNVNAFGVEAQRILRLEKGHVIVNQDTDSLTSPLEIGLNHIVRSPKVDYVGKNQIHQHHNRGVKRKLVGFKIDGKTPTPKDGAAILHQGVPVGRVTSARRSSINQNPIGLAILPEDLCVQNQEVLILINEELYLATVSLEPAYDPKGIRLKE
tara:strand:+ start:18195 stop:20987 length:2793 start_codon:yes stop_codon:yes gene_type:complete